MNPVPASAIALNSLSVAISLAVTGCSIAPVQRAVHPRYRHTGAPWVEVIWALSMASTHRTVHEAVPVGAFRNDRSHPVNLRQYTLGRGAVGGVADIHISRVG
jgi:hypothetical protein